MSGIWNVLKSVFDHDKYVDINLSELPSRGQFYPDDLTIKIKQAEEEDIDKYHSRYIEGDFMSIFMGIKYVVKHNVKLPKNYMFENIISIDVLYIFLEIVKLTKNRDILISVGDETVVFGPDSFKYFEFTENYLENFDDEHKEFVYDGFRYSPPTVGAESSISRFMYEMHRENRLEEFSDSSYDFLYFLGGKAGLKNEEIINLITIFNDELEDKDKKTISRIIEEFRPVSKYMIKTKKNGVVPLENLDLKNIWSE